MIDEKSELKTINVETVLPPNGTYPPRLISMLGTTWINEGASITIYNTARISNENGTCYIYPIAKTSKTKLNGKPLLDRQRLYDGCFIHHEINGIRYILQADPVKDYRRVLQTKWLELPKEVTLTPRIEEHVLIDKDGISLNAGKDKMLWGEISVIFFVINLQTQEDEFGIRVSSPERDIPSTLEDKLTPDDIVSFYEWVLVEMPFVISFFSLFGGEFIDDYALSIYQKLLLPSELYDVPLPVPRHILTGESTKVVRWINRLMAVSFGLGLIGLLLFKQNPVL